MGEIGKPIYELLAEFYETYRMDQDQQLADALDQNMRFDVIHICFGHKENEVEDFKQWVENYQERFLKYSDSLTIIHSTVAKGVSEQLRAVHSPVIGQHPKLKQFITSYPIDGSNVVEEATYKNRGVYINENQYFGDVRN